jgi:flagellar basal body-associated protein FliL
MNMLEILFVALPVVALVAALALFFSVIKKDREYTITLNIESEEEGQAPITSELVAKPKRRYKKRKKKAPVAAPAAPEVVPVATKRVGRPRKTT